MSEGIVYALLAGYPVLITAIGVLYRDLRKSQESRLKGEREHTKTLENMLNIANGGDEP